MASITTRAGKGSALSNAELDANFNNLNAESSALTYSDLGNSGTSTQTLNYSSAKHFKVTATGNHTIAFSNWPASGTAVILLDLVNGGAYTVTLPTINWLKPDGTTTTSFSTYLAALGIAGRTTLLASGTDRMMFRCTANGTPEGMLIL